MLTLQETATANRGPGSGGAWQWTPSAVECNDPDGWTRSYGANCLRSNSGACIPNLCPAQK